MPWGMQEASEGAPANRLRLEIAAPAPCPGPSGIHDQLRWLAGVRWWHGTSEPSFKVFLRSRRSPADTTSPRGSCLPILLCIVTCKRGAGCGVGSFPKGY